MIKDKIQEIEESVAGIKQKRVACYEKIDSLKQNVQEASVVENTLKMNMEQVQENQREIWDEHGTKQRRVI